MCAWLEHTHGSPLMSGEVTLQACHRYSAGYKGPSLVSLSASVLNHAWGRKCTEGIQLLSQLLTAGRMMVSLSSFKCPKVVLICQQPFFYGNHQSTLAGMNTALIYISVQ